MSNLTPDDEQKILELRAHWDLLFNYAQIIAVMPLEKWLEDFDRGESLAAIIDPTLYRDYLYGGQGEVIKTVIRGALELKRAIIKAQAQVQSKAS